jgi:hypothetical protein
VRSAVVPYLGQARTREYPHTVRLTGCANNPATIIVNVSKVGAVKHGRKVASTRDSAR